MTKKAPSVKPQASSAIETSKSKRLKMWGSGILLFAFATQQVLVAKYIGKVEDYFRGYQSYSSSYNSSLIYENLYFSQAVATGNADGNVLRKAALDNVSGFSVFIVSSELPKLVKERKIATLMEAARRVNDLDSYNEYKESMNNQERYFMRETENKFAYVSRLKDVVTWVYLVVYVIGSGVLIMAIRYE